jgi:outer membrane protein TolC
MEIGADQLGLTTDTELEIPAQSWDLRDLISRAYQASPELALLANQEQGATIDVEVTENGLLPRLDAAITFGPSGTGDDPGSALTSMAKFDGVTAIGSLSYEQTLGKHAVAGQARTARAQRERIRVNAIDLRLQIAQSLATEVALLKSAEQRAALGARAIELATKNIAVEQSRFGLGKSTNFDVLQRQEELKAAQLRRVRAIIDWHKAATLAAATTGDLLEQYGITLETK